MVEREVSSSLWARGYVPSWKPITAAMGIGVPLRLERAWGMKSGRTQTDCGVERQHDSTISYLTILTTINIPQTPPSSPPHTTS